MAKKNVATNTNTDKGANTNVESANKVTPSHEVPEALKAFKDAQREGKAGLEAPEALVVEDKTAQIKQVTVKCLDNGSFRVGQQFFCLNKGKNVVLPDYVAAEFRKNNLIE